MEVVGRSRVLHNEANLLMKFHICVIYIVKYGIHVSRQYWQALSCILDEDMCLKDFAIRGRKKMREKFGALGIRHLSFISHEAHTKGGRLFAYCNRGWLKSNQLNPGVGFF